MPIKSCTLPDGKEGYKWGDRGHCYADRSRAVAQAQAAFASGYKGEDEVSTVLSDGTKISVISDGGGGSGNFGHGGRPGEIGGSGSGKGGDKVDETTAYRSIDINKTREILTERGISHSHISLKRSLVDQKKMLEDLAKEHGLKPVYMARVSL